MRTSAEQVLRDAVRDHHPNESFEKSLARAVKEHKGTYQDYIDLMGKIRERARKEKGTLSDAAKALAAEL